VERRKNEELLSLNKQLEEQVQQLNLRLELHEKKIEEEHTLNLEFESKVTNLILQVETLVKEKQEKEEVNLQLITEKQTLEVTVADVNIKFETLVKENEVKTQDVTKKEAEDANVIQELKKKNTFFEEEIETLRNDVDNFKIQLENEKKDKDDQIRIIIERTEQDNAHRKGLQVLRRNLDQHIEDLHVWQKYLNSKDQFLDFDREIRPSLDSELHGKDFVDQLNVLSGKLDAENDIMLKIFKTKAAEQKAAELEAVVSKKNRLTISLGIHRKEE